MLRVRTQHGYRLSHLLPIATHLRVTNLPMFIRPVSPGQIVLSHGAAANQSQFVRPTFEAGINSVIVTLRGGAVLPAVVKWLLMTVAHNDQAGRTVGVTNRPLNDHYCLWEAQ